MENEPQPIFSHAEPVLAVEDVSETISYWQNVLGFTTKLMWGNPPEWGAVSWQKIFVQFSKNPRLANASKGNSIWIRVQHIETLYHFHQKKNAEIVEPLEDKPWGMAQYTIREPNGYFLTFAGLPTDKEKSSGMPESIQIISRTPTVNEFRDLQISVGWTPSKSDAVMNMILSAAIFAVVAKDSLSNEVIGCTLLLGDGATFYYVKDVIVHPKWQGKRIGSAMMHEVNEWLKKNGANNALIGLFTRETLESFYQQFDFVQSFAMLKFIRNDETK